MPKSVLLVASLFLVVPALTQTVTLQGSDFTVKIAPGLAYTIAYWESGGYVLVDQCGSYQGTVITYNGSSWYGTGHGGEEVQSVLLFVDDMPREWGSSSYQGSSFRLVKISLLGPLVRLESQIVFSSSCIFERAALTVLDPGVTMQTVYCFMSTHDNLLTSALAVDPNGVMTLAETTSDDSSFVYFGQAQVVAQYDPLAGRGVSAWLRLERNFPSSMFVWDRSTDNKLYWSATGCLGWQPAGMSWVFETRRFPFQANSENWVSAALNSPSALTLFVGCMTPDAIGVSDACLPADLDGDGDVDLIDFSLLRAPS